MNNDWLKGRAQPSTPPGWVAAHIATAQRGIAIRGWALDDEWWGTPYHFDGRSIICTDSRDCPLCLAKLGRKWAGYLPMFDAKTGGRFIMTFTEQIATKLKHLKMVHGSLRRYQIVLTREGQNRNGKLHVNMDDTTRAPARIPELWDYRANILHMYGFCFEQISELLAECPLSKLRIADIG